MMNVIDSLTNEGQVSIETLVSDKASKPKELLKLVNHRYVASLKEALGSPLPRSFKNVKVPLSALEEVLSVINPDLLSEFENAK